MSYPRAIIEFLRRQPETDVIEETDIDAYEQFLDEQDADARRERGAAKNMPF